MIARFGPTNQPYSNNPLDFAASRHGNSAEKRWRFSVWQFGSDGRPLEGLAECIAATELDNEWNADLIAARGAARAFSNLSWNTISRCLGGGEAGSVQKSSVSRRSKSDKNAHAFHLGTTTRCPPRCLPAAQSAQIHAQRLKLSNLGSLEPDNSDTFASSPL